MDSEKKQKRHCRAAYRKWTELDQIKLLNFLKENRPVEKPTAQVYYRRYMSENAVDCDWTLIRCKVKNMRQSYLKFKAMLNSPEATFSDGETIRDSILKKCPLFESYEEVFGEGEDTYEITELDTEIQCGYDGNPSVTSNLADWPMMAIHNLKQEISFDGHDSQSAASPQSQSAPPSESQFASVEKSSTHEEKDVYSRTELSDLLHVQNEIINIKKDKQEKEIKLKEAELVLQKEMFLFEKEKQIADREMERELRIMEIHMKKEIALKKLEMKTKIALKKLEMKQMSKKAKVQTSSQTD